MEGPLEFLLYLIELIASLFVGSDEKHSRKPRNTTYFKLIIVFLSVLTFFSLLIEFSLNPQLIPTIGWWFFLLPLTLPTAYFFIRYQFHKKQLLHLPPILFVFIVLLFVLLGVSLIGIWFV